MIFKIVARELEGLTVDHPEDNTEDNIEMSEREEHLINEVSWQAADEDEAQTGSLEKETEVSQQEIDAENTVSLTEAIEKNNILTREKSEAEQKVVEYKMKVVALESRIAKLKYELSKKAS